MNSGPRWRAATVQPLLGTTVEVRVLADTDERAGDAEAAVVAEIQRLSSVYSVFDPASELSRWRRGEVDEVSADLARALDIAETWFAASGGAFHPGCRALTALWEQAAVDGALPDPARLAATVRGLGELPFRVRRGGTSRVERAGDCTGVDLNAFAKGLVVDRAGERARTLPGVRGLVVNAGGDLRHWGTGDVTVRLEDPSRPFDNAEPLTRVRVRDAAVATSGSVHRGFRVRGRWFGHVVDPRTGEPIGHTVSASVLASDAATADVLATVVLVLPLEQALAFVDGYEECAALLVGDDRRVHRSAHWPAGT